MDGWDVLAVGGFALFWGLVAAMAHGCERLRPQRGGRP
ncbi:hypothetical protein DFQ15_104151 [Xylophilus ampelinus]|uniref:Uncharacterized protein n=1 Tax=Xylophilus ampelinus TaxID=54067 RepID=A0A318SIY9_9BURK|nr:hypothetical protein DFQ15_104151 [Xylophilus ampelinus]